MAASADPIPTGAVAGTGAVWLSLTLQPGEPLTGVVTREAAMPGRPAAAQSFQGWVELMLVIETLRSRPTALG